MVLKSFVSTISIILKILLNPQYQRFQVAIDENKEQETLIIDLKSINKNEIINTTINKSSIKSMQNFNLYK